MTLGKLLFLSEPCQNTWRKRAWRFPMSFPKVTVIPGSASSEVVGLSWPSGRHSKRQQEGGSPRQQGRAGERAWAPGGGGGGRAAGLRPLHRQGEGDRASDFSSKSLLSPSRVPPITLSPLMLPPLCHKESGRSHPLHWGGH